MNQLTSSPLLAPLLTSLALAFAGTAAAVPAAVAPAAVAPVRALPHPAPQSSGAALATEAAVEAHPLSRIALVGASLSAGAGNAAELELKGDAPLGTFVRSMLAERHGDAEVFDLGNTYFFMNPRLKGRSQINEAIAKKPTAVVAADFLFWFGYGEEAPGDARRLEGIREGLSLLERIECPLVIGDLPNIEHALKGKGPFGGPLVNRRMFPTEAERLRMNATIRAWASERKQVTVMPLADLMDELRSGDTIEIEANRWDVNGVGDALQKDLLHPSVRGSVWTTMVLARSMTDWKGVSKTDFVWDEKAIAARLWAATEDARAARKASQERAAKRRLERERRKREAAKTGSGKR